MEQSLVLFSLYREQDHSGISGTGTVAYGIKFPEPNGRVVLGWVPAADRTSVAVYDSMEEMEQIHSHGGSTKIIQLDKLDCGGPQ